MKIEKIKRRNSFISKGKSENRQTCEWCGILNRRIIPKFANFWNFDSFPNFKNSENSLIFKVAEFRKFVDLPIWKIFNLENSKNL